MCWQVCEYRMLLISQICSHFKNMCVGAHVLVCADIQAHVNVCICVPALGVSPFSFGSVSLTRTWDSASWVDWLVSELQGSSCLCLSHARIPGRNCHSLLFHGCWGSELRPSCSFGKFYWPYPQPPFILENLFLILLSFWPFPNLSRRESMYFAGMS